MKLVGDLLIDGCLVSGMLYQVSCIRLYQALYQAGALICQSTKLNGKETRFLRTEIDMPQAGLAELMGVDVPTVANWEKGNHDINGAAERLLRLFAGERLLNGGGR